MYVIRGHVEYLRVGHLLRRELCGCTAEHQCCGDGEGDQPQGLDVASLQSHCTRVPAVSYTHLTLPTTPYV